MFAPGIAGGDAVDGDASLMLTFGILASNIKSSIGGRSIIPFPELPLLISLSMTGEGINSLVPDDPSKLLLLPRGLPVGVPTVGDSATSDTGAALVAITIFAEDCVCFIVIRLLERDKGFVLIGLFGGDLSGNTEKGN
jgi:hypothetical protein